MTKIKTRFRQFIYVIKHDYLTSSNIIFCIAVIFCAAWTYGSIMAMTRNWTLSEQIASKERELQRLQLEVETLELENQYYASEEYKELAARAKGGKKLPGETMILLPANSDYARTKHASDNIVISSEPSNISRWLSFLFGI